MSNTLLLEAKDLTKRFGTLVSNDKIDIKVEAGKSMRCLVKMAPVNPLL